VKVSTGDAQALAGEAQDTLEAVGSQSNVQLESEMAATVQTQVAHKTAVKPVTTKIAQKAAAVPQKKAAAQPSKPAPAVAVAEKN